LPSDFGKTASGAVHPRYLGKAILGGVHSNYKTQPCKNMLNGGYCRYGEACHFYHNEQERRNLIDTLPDLPEGVILPPMPQWIRN